MKQKPISPQDRQMAVEYLVGATMPVLAKQHRIPLTAVWHALHRVLKQAAFRSRGRPRKREKD